MRQTFGEASRFGVPKAIDSQFAGDLSEVAFWYVACSDERGPCRREKPGLSCQLEQVRCASVAVLDLTYRCPNGLRLEVYRSHVNFHDLVGWVFPVALHKLAVSLERGGDMALKFAVFALRHGCVSPLSE